MSIPKSKVKWESKKIIRHENGRGCDDYYEYEIIIPDFLASWDVWDYWEKERFDSMRSFLRKGDILFDVGTEVGWANIIYAGYVGGENMVLIEPTPYFWPNIKATWLKNKLPKPKACFAGFFGEDTNINKIPKRWPKETKGDLVERMAYKYLFNDKVIPRIRIDDFVKQTGIVPDALTIDTEGAELSIFKGAINVFKKYKPIVWASIHPDLALRDYGHTEKATLKFMSKLSYKYKLLAVDHEKHYIFY